MFKRTIPVLTIIALFCSCEKDTIQPAEIPATKAVTFTIAQGSDYSLPIYIGLQAEVKLSIVKESIVNVNVTAVWDTTFSLRSIRDYAVSTNPLIITKQVSGVLQSKEAVRVSRVIRYVTPQNQISQDALGESITPSVTVKQVLVSL